jgi:CubicO group peptidase (beta-lactamase class C family)
MRTRCHHSGVAGRVAMVAMAAALLACRGGDEPTGPGADAAFARCVDPIAYWPTAGWRRTCPGAVGVDSAMLRAGLRHADATMPSLRAFAVARRGWLVAEMYRGMRAGDPVDLRSVTKAVTATMVGAAVHAGSIDSTGQLLSELWPEYLVPPDDPRKARLRVEHLLDLTGGFMPNSSGTPNVDLVPAVLSRPMLEEPGTSWWYDEALYQILPALVAKVDPRGPVAVARDDVFAPLGMAGAIRRWPVDALARPWGAAGLELTIAEMLKIGELYRRDGVWDGRRILPEGWVAEITRRPPDAPGTATYWSRGWRQTMLEGHLVYYALGYAGQYIIVVPSLELVAVAGSDVHASGSRFPDVLGLMSGWIIPAIEQG